MMQSKPKGVIQYVLPNVGARLQAVIQRWAICPGRSVIHHMQLRGLFVMSEYTVMWGIMKPSTLITSRITDDLHYTLTKLILYD